MPGPAGENCHCFWRFPGGGGCSWAVVLASGQAGDCKSFGGLSVRMLSVTFLEPVRLLGFPLECGLPLLCDWLALLLLAWLVWLPPCGLLLCPCSWPLLAVGGMGCARFLCAFLRALPAGFRAPASPNQTKPNQTQMVNLETGPRWGGRSRT